MLTTALLFLLIGVSGLLYRVCAAALALTIAALLPFAAGVAALVLVLVIVLLS